MFVRLKIDIRVIDVLKSFQWFVEEVNVEAAGERMRGENHF